MRLTSATTLNEFGSLTYHLTSIQSMITDHIVAHHDTELGFVVVMRAYNTKQRTIDGSANLKGQILSCSRRHGQHCGDDLDTIHIASLLNQTLSSTFNSLSLETFYFFLHVVVLLNIFLDDTLKIFGVVEE